MNERKKRLLSKILLCTMSASMIMSAGCGSQNDDSKGTIAVIAKAKDVRFWDSVKKGAEDAGEEMGYKISYSAPDNETQVDEQIDMINKAIQDKVKAIVIAPIDTDELNDSLRDADEAGIKVITIDSDVSFTDRISYIGTNNESAGSIAARQAASIIGQKGEIAVVGHVQTSQTAQERIKGFKDQIAAICDSKSVDDMSVVAEEYCNGNSETAKEKTKEILDKHPDVKLIYGTNEKSTIGICEAVDELGLSGNVKVIGFNSNDKEIEYINQGTLSGVILQNPYNMGYLGIRYSDKSINDNYISSSIDTGVIFVDKSNIDTDEVKIILNS